METAKAYISYKSSGNVDLKIFMRQQLKAAGVYRGENELAEAINEIDETFSRIDANHRQILEYKKRGLATSRWIEEKISKLQGDYTPGDKQQIPEVIHQSINQATLKVIEQADFIEGPVQLEQPVSYIFEDLNKKAVSQAIQRAVGQNQAVDWAEDAGGKAEYAEDHPAASIFQDFFASKLGEPSAAEQTARTIAATSAIKAANAGYFKPLADKSPAEIAAMVDNGLTRIKIGYKIANGEIKVPDAIEYGVDRAAARAEALVSQGCRKAGRFIGEKIGGVIGSVFGPVGTVVGGTVGKVVGDIVGQQVGEKANQGVRKVAEAAKEACKEAWDGVKVVASKAWSGFKSGFKSLFGR
ncbi:hypothetical protein [Saccharibacillus qingshengii]|uniref:hypothetical protein n=1 Tax=Saccharibacillus qingshengii TaxID=1763540 RepID=UPI00155196E7|nr:hypothetical protein [Saccharibacillus qingshengii]